MGNKNNVIWGLLLIFLGVIIGLNILDIVSIDIFFNGWWTLFIIVPCFVGLFNDSDKTGNLIGMLVGILLLLACQHIINFAILWKILLPMIVIFFGLSLIFKGRINNKVNDEIKKLNKSNKVGEYNAIFSSQKLDFKKEKFTGATLNAVFGGVDIDLRDSIINNDVVINASGIFGGIDIHVPNDVKVCVKSNCIFGGVEEKKKVKDNDGKYTIYINASCIFGGVDIK